MVENKYDTFENENEIDELIKSLQEKCIEYMKQPDAWEFDSSKKNELVCKQN